MQRSTTPVDGGDGGSRLTVFRARRRCTKCGLINVDNAARCRRCGQSFSGVNRAAESERVVASLQAWKLAVGLVVLLLLVGGVAGAWLFFDRSARLSAYTDRARTVEADVIALRHGAEADASRVVGAFDDVELRQILDEQKATWANRASQCDTLGAQLDELVPQDADQTANELRLEREVGALASASKRIAQAAASGDVFSARSAAASLAKGEDAEH